jgi:hypothetical protein
MRIVRKVGAGLAAALVAGLLLGALARVMMRLVNLAAGRPGEFSWLGTAGILLVFVVVTVPGALLAAFLQRRGRSALLVLGALLLGVSATGVAVADLGDVGPLSVRQMAGVGAAGLGVYVAILLLPVLTLRLLRPRVVVEPRVGEPRMVEPVETTSRVVEPVETTPAD